MTTFPSVRPDPGRSYTFGQYQGEMLTYPNKDVSRYMTGNQITNPTLTLPYSILSTAEKNLLVVHYTTHGMWLAFDLPAMIWCYLTGDDHPVFSSDDIFFWKEPFSCSARGAGFWEGSAVLRRAIRMID
jgi:hypothetical protein